jgi:hypothetical protein
MNKAKGNWRQLQRLWPVAMAMLAACGGASESADEAATLNGDVATTTGMESAEGRRSSSWVYCAAEGATCTVPSQRLVRYGASGAYFFRKVSGSISCSNGMWGDPVYGVAKKCEYSASTTAVTPAPNYSGTASLTWNAPVAPVLSGYRVYYGTASGKYQQAARAGAWAGNVTAFNVTGLLKGATYYFAVTSVDSQGNESAFSSEASKLVQ